MGVAKKTVGVAKNRVRQVNRQSNSTRLTVNVNCNKGNCHKVKYHRRKKPVQREKVVTECMCGKVFQPCDGSERVYFRAVSPLPSAILRIENESECEMQVTIELWGGQAIIERVGAFQQYFSVVPSIRRLVIRCVKSSGETKTRFCQGEFALKLHVKVGSRSCSRPFSI